MKKNDNNSTIAPAIAGFALGISMLSLLGIAITATMALDYKECVRADANSDGRVDAQDYQHIKSHLGERNCGPENDWCDFADTNQDGRVTTADYSLVKKHLGEVCCVC